MPEREGGTKPRTGGVGLWRGMTGGRRLWRNGAISWLRWRSRATSRKRLGAAYKIVRNQTTGELPAAKPEKMPRIFPFDISSLQESTASLLSCAPIDEREMPLPGAGSFRRFNRVAAKSTIPQCACQWSENTEKLQETCTRPICMHAKMPATSVACGIRGRRFYLALFRRSPRAALVDIPFGAPLHAAICCTTPHFLQSYGATKRFFVSRLDASIRPAISPISRLRLA